MFALTTSRPINHHYNVVTTTITTTISYHGVITVRWQKAIDWSFEHCICSTKPAVVRPFAVLYPSRCIRVLGVHERTMLLGGLCRSHQAIHYRPVVFVYYVLSTSIFHYLHYHFSSILFLTSLTTLSLLMTILRRIYVPPMILVTFLLVASCQSIFMFSLC